MTSSPQIDQTLTLPLLPAGWLWQPLQELVDPSRGICYGVVQPGGHDPSGVPMVNSGDIHNGRVKAKVSFRVSVELHKKYRRSTLRGGEVLVTLVGANFGQVAIAPSHYAGHNCARPVGIVPVLESARYVMYALQSPLLRQRMDNVANTTAQPTLNLKDLGLLPVPVPPACVRDRLADFLGEIDDRIALLRETNATLEAIAQALFKSWFVDFDPVHAKRDGRAPDGMGEATSALFPDSFEESESGLVPKGWTYCSLKEVTQIHDAKRVPLSGAERDKRRGSYPYYGAAALMDFVDDFLFDGIYLLSGEDGSVANEFGFPITQYVWGKFWVNNHAHVLQGKAGISTEHLMLSLKNTNIQPFITGAVQAKLSQANMWRIKFMRPTQEVAETFASLLQPLFSSIRHNSDEARTLTTLRDTLLPRLISGQLRLPEKEDFLSSVQCQP